MAGALSDYHAKRDFARTAEPRGTVARRRGKALRFVVQKHDATRLHYDFRLELDGVLKSWAVTRGPSPDPADKRLAVQVEDHPLDYADFEGRIAEGYGAGTVLLWDSGTWEPGGTDPAKDLEAGRLSFTLHGDRMTGGWHLIRMRPRGRNPKQQWLLVKDDDEAARPGEAEAFLAADTSVKSGKTLEDLGGKPAKPAPAKPRATARPKRPPAPKDHSPPATIEGVRLTHPEKRLWPEDGITKRALADYLVAVAPRLLAWIAGRPLSLLSAPDGIGAATFFLRHASRGTPRDLRPIRTRDEEKPWLAANDVAALLSLAQYNILEIHPWPARGDRIAQPDRLVLDLDPGDDVPFAEVVRAAHLCRERLAAAGLTPFCKTTGGKGLHVVAPVAGATWPRLLAFAKATCTALAGEMPDRFTVSVAKAARPGRIYLDYGRNAREASAVAAYSPRARAGATVSTPLAWEEVTEALDPHAFTIRTLPDRLLRPDPWAAFDDAARPCPRPAAADTALPVGLERRPRRRARHAIRRHEVRPAPAIHQHPARGGRSAALHLRAASRAGEPAALRLPALPLRAGLRGVLPALPPHPPQAAREPEALEVMAGRRVGMAEMVADDHLRAEPPGGAARGERGHVDGLAGPTGQRARKPRRAGAGRTSDTQLRDRLPVARPEEQPPRRQRPRAAGRPDEPLHPAATILGQERDCGVALHHRRVATIRARIEAAEGAPGIGAEIEGHHRDLPAEQRREIGIGGLIALRQRARLRRRGPVMLAVAERVALPHRPAMRAARLRRQEARHDPPRRVDAVRLHQEVQGRRHPPVLRRRCPRPGRQRDRQQRGSEVAKPHGPRPQSRGRSKASG
ncbi:non-homologous end-joining DNA ligase [Roseomonas sp. CCTCC AB2023176]|uniref:non-homologous end-joining DNA ligase n=1 Tax=Roseomonas sp. CCTCC AB2023176 TaxID=3342640 RepID=UPI0035DE3736